MNLLAILVVFGSIVYSQQQEDCVRNGRGLCELVCPPGTFMYTPGCGEGQISYTQRTCKDPVATPMGEICDLRRCDCCSSKVWDENAKKCVKLSQCFDQTQNQKPVNDIYV